jgi:hypothetical protein
MGIVETMETCDNADLLSYAVYGHKGKARHLVGGSDAPIFRDAADLIRSLRSQLEAERERCARVADEYCKPDGKHYRTAQAIASRIRQGEGT